jgi:hypothetical protein
MLSEVLANPEYIFHLKYCRCLGNYDDLDVDHYDQIDYSIRVMKKGREGLTPWGMPYPEEYVETIQIWHDRETDTLRLTCGAHHDLFMEGNTQEVIDKILKRTVKKIK